MPLRVPATPAPPASAPPEADVIQKPAAVVAETPASPVWAPYKPGPAAIAWLIFCLLGFLVMALGGAPLVGPVIYLVMGLEGLVLSRRSWCLKTGRQGLLARTRIWEIVWSLFCLLGTSLFLLDLDLTGIVVFFLLALIGIIPALLRRK